MFRRKLILNNKKGITLIALIVTIIILLILAGVALNFVVGENGILRHAEFAKEKYENKAQIEQNELAQLDDYISNGRDTVTISKEEYDMLKNANSYSTDEKKIGTWIDGKPIYQKTFTGSWSGTWDGQYYVLISFSSQLVSDVDKYVDCKIYTDNGTMDSSTIEVQTSTQFRIKTHQNSTFTAITLQYTKTTDTATNN